MPRRFLGLSAVILAALALSGLEGAALAAEPFPGPGLEPGAGPRVVRVVADEGGGMITGLGTARCRRSLEMGFEATGQIAAIPVEEGAKVVKGQVLARLDDRVLSAELKAKRAEVEASQAEVQRLAARAQEKEKLFQSRAATANEAREAGFELAKAQAKLEAAQAEVASLSARVESFILRAPMDGVVAKRISEPGEVVTPNGRKVLRFLDCRQVLAEVEFGERLYTRLAPGLEVTLVADALPGRRFNGKIHAISPEIDEKNRTFTVKVAVDNPDFMLKPGMFVRAAVQAAGQGQTLWLPPEALTQVKGDEALVTVLEDRRPVERRVRLGRREPGRVEITGGASAGELVVLPSPGPAAGGRP